MQTNDYKVILLEIQVPYFLHFHAARPTFAGQ